MNGTAKPQAYERKGISCDWLALWILFPAWSSLTGWVLSVLGYLNLAGIIFAYSLVSNAFIARYNQVYSVYATRFDAFKELIVPMA
jgi:hypothetical protein